MIADLMSVYCILCASTALPFVWGMEVYGHCDTCISDRVCICLLLYLGFISSALQPVFFLVVVPSRRARLCWQQQASALSQLFGRDVRAWPREAMHVIVCWRV